MADRAYLERLTKEFTDQGKLIEAGWVGLRLAAVPDHAPAMQLDEMRMAFMAGAAHLFASINTILEPGQEPTDADMTRMDLIHRELQHFEVEFARKHGLDKQRRGPKVETPPLQSSASHTLGDAPIEEQHRERMNAIAHVLDEYFNGENPTKRAIGFVLLVFAYGSDPGRCNFISNGADRKDIAILFKEMIARFEGQPEMKGRA